MQRHTKKLSPPLPPKYFECPPLSSDESHSFLQAAQTQLTDFHSIANLKSPDVTMHWSLEKSTTDGLHIYTGHDFAAPSGTVSLMAVTQLFASLDEVQDMFHTTDDDDYKAFCATFAPGIVDYASLYTLARAHLGHYVGIKWHALQRLTPLSKPRDACTLECHRRFSFAAGGRGWAYTMRSIDLPDVCPDMQNVLDVIRMQVSMLGCTFREIADRPGWLQVTVLVQANPRGSFPQWAFKQAVKRRLLSIAQWDGRFRHRRLAKHAQLLPRAALVPATARRVCYLCRQRFSAFRSKCNCRVCGQVVCRTCQHTWRLHDIDVSVCAACSHNPLAQTPASPEAPPPRISTFHESMLPTGDMGAFFVPSTLSSRSPRSIQPSFSVMNGESSRPRFSLNLTQMSRSPLASSQYRAIYEHADEILREQDLLNDDFKPLVALSQRSKSMELERDSEWDAISTIAIVM
ncbi:unnamed protein product [Aphanomyces euteiches]